MKKADSQIIRKVSEKLNHRVVLARVPNTGIFVEIAKGKVTKQSIAMEPWPSELLKLTGYANHEAVKTHHIVDIPVPVNHLMGRKTIKNIYKKQGLEGLKKLLISTINLSNR
ncbi:MAG: hypothetical protein VYB44_07110 [Bacteroidota bacterium]|nr:hypothetical protein [Bacteroidota bacterium]